ncbi:MAG: hypothetical protein ACOYM3_04700 [Terrimicrobiaceae bacterium]
MIPLPPNPAPGYPILDWARSAQETLRRSRPVAGPGIRITESTNNLVISADAARPADAAATPTPWDVLSYIAGTGALRLYPGLVNGLLPSNILSPITVSDAGVTWIIVRQATDGKRITSSLLVAVTTPPVSPSTELGGAPSSFDWPVLLRAEKTFFPLERSNLYFDTFEAWREAVETVEPGAPQWDSYWTWKK